MFNKLMTTKHDYFIYNYILFSISFPTIFLNDYVCTALTV